MPSRTQSACTARLGSTLKIGGADKKTKPRQMKERVITLVDRGPNKLLKKQTKKNSALND